MIFVIVHLEEVCNYVYLCSVIRTTYKSPRSWPLHAPPCTVPCKLLRAWLFKTI